MQSALARVNTRRVWFVPQFSVWGAADWGEIQYLVIENVESIKTVLFGTARLGEDYQSVKFEELTDFRGNALPASLKNPRVLIRPRSNSTAFIVGDESSKGFCIARQTDSANSVTVDLLVVELGD